MTADEPPMTIAMVEFVWHKKGPDFSEEALLAHTEKWAGIVDEAGWNLRSAAVITPRFDNPNADFMWAMAWPSAEARNTAWSEWAESYEADWLASSEGVFTYDSETVPTFKPNRGRVSSMPTPVGGTGVREYSFVLTTKVSVRTIWRPTDWHSMPMWMVSRRKPAPLRTGGHT